MKAMVYHRYGPPDVLGLAEIPKPIPKDSQVLIKVHAVSLNPYDLHYLRGTPLPLRLEAGIAGPKHKILGVDVAGHIEEVGRDVNQFQPGDEVFGDLSGSGMGGLAEYVSASADRLALKPENITFAEAAAVPMAAVSALQALRDRGKIQAGQKVLVNGASGGVGSFAVQIAKSYGAEVTAVCSSRNQDMVYSLGADKVIDYTQNDFTREGQEYHLIIDAVGNCSVSHFKRALTPNGISVVVGYTSAVLMIQIMLLGPLASLTGNQKIGAISAVPKSRDLEVLKTLIEARKVVPVIKQQYLLEETVEAFKHLETGHARGKIVITI